MTENTDKRPLRAFVAGATGFTGREVVRLLVEKGVETHAHVRPDSSRLEEWRVGFEGMGAKVDTTPWDEKKMSATISDLAPECVFALLGTTRARMKKAANAGFDPLAQSYEAVDYGLTAMLLRAAKTAGSDTRFIYLSASGTNPKSMSPYYKARSKAEKEIIDSGLPYSIARPSIITGPDRDDNRPGERIGAVVADAMLGAAALFGARKLKARYSSTTNAALATALVEMALDPGAQYKIFESEELR